MALRVGINGFGRIGRNVYRATRKLSTDIEIVAVNDLMEPGTAAHLLKHDTILGAYPGNVSVEEDVLVVDGKRTKVLAERDPANLPWKDLGVDIVVESTGLFTDGTKARAHLDAGAKKVIISAPAKNEDVTICMGVNQHTYDPAVHNIISNASCTTNCLAPVAKVLNDHFGIEMGFMTTAHAYTNDQQLLDGPHKDLRRARSATQAIVPTSTGAAKAIGLVIPELVGKMHGVSLRVPVPDVSLIDLTVNLAKPATAEEINAEFKKASEGEMNGILAITEEELVSADFLHDPHSAIVDSKLTMVLKDKMAKVFAYYDNEWAYSCRVVDLVDYIGQRLS